ncbi:hypothetical protein MRS44_017877 [Fusarium solani]|uniref:uncharacterized protein n=1 Tax=Fusarium solani TaxID=169388 RepID=UPI0032C42AD4|nr:hypothetical protein MRS44_017877 [Fusarium solani]
MDSEVIVAWISDQHRLLHACSDPETCQLTLQYEESISTPSRRRQRYDLEDHPSPKRLQTNRPDIDSTFDEVVVGDTMRRSPRKNAGAPSSQQTPTTATSSQDDVAIIEERSTARTTLPHRQLRQPVLPPPQSFTAKLSSSERQSFASASREQSSVTSRTSRTRSTSPVKNPDDLLKLEKPVTWTTPDPRALRNKIEETGSAQALELFSDIWKVIQGDGFLPRELKTVLQDELMVPDGRFAAEDRVAVVDAKAVHDARTLFPSFNDGMGNLLAIYNELSTVRDIVANTIRFVKTTRSEATWNDHIHGPVLRLAMSNMPHVNAENITQASIAKPFVPASRGELETLSGKMIDYALLLQPDKDLSSRIATFVDELDGPKSFNQSTHGPLCYEPSGVLVETKVDTRRRAEGKAQLGIWLAAWYGRVAKYEPLASSPGNSERLPFLPVLLVVCESWELYFAFDAGGEFEVCGPLEIGSTMTVEGSYRLLAVLRLLADWVDGEFRNWVERCVL